MDSTLTLWYLDTRRHSRSYVLWAGIVSLERREVLRMRLREQLDRAAQSVWQRLALDGLQVRPRVLAEFLANGDNDGSNEAEDSATGNLATARPDSVDFDTVAPIADDAIVDAVHENPFTSSPGDGDDTFGFPVDSTNDASA